MNTRNNLTRPGSTRLETVRALPVVVTLGVLLGAQTGLAKEDDGVRGRFCSATALTLFEACRNGVRDDFFTTKAKCINVADANERRQCLAETEEARREDLQLCQEQLDGRREACESLGEDRYDPDIDPALFDDPRNPTNPNPYYLEEFSLGNAEDVTEILSVTYPIGSDPELDHLVPPELVKRFCSGDCVVTRNFSLLEPGIFALKYYARGIGFFLEVVPDTGEVLQLVDCSFDSRCVGLPTVTGVGRK